jgi:hypothetical protein
VFFFGRLIFVFFLLQDLRKKEAVVGVVGVQPLHAIVVEAPKPPMLTASETKKKESLPAPDVVVNKEKESTAAPEVGAKDKDSAPKPTTEAAKDKAPSPSHVDAEV